MFPSTAVSTVVGIGGAAGAAGGAAFTWVVKHNLSPHPLMVFCMAALAYLTALGFSHALVPVLGPTHARFTAKDRLVLAAFVMMVVALYFVTTRG
jgi:hypothetical protein